MDRSDPDGSPLAKKRTSTRRKFVREVYKPSNRKLPPNRRLWPCENLNEISEEESIRHSVKPLASLENVKVGSKDQNDLKNKPGLKPTRKIPSRSEKLVDKSNAQKKQVKPTGRITRSSVMTNDGVGRSKMEVLDEEEKPKHTSLKEAELVVLEEEEEAESFLDVSADQRINAILMTSKPTQQSLGADVTFTFDMDKHSRALADCSPIPKVGRLASQPSGSKNNSRLELPSTGALKISERIVSVPKSSAAPSPPKKRTRREATARSSRNKVSNGSLSDDPMMI